MFTTIKSIVTNLSNGVLRMSAHLKGRNGERGEESASVAAITGLVLLIILVVMGIFRGALIAAFERIAGLLGF